MFRAGYSKKSVLMCYFITIAGSKIEPVIQ
jgi:hypothetical protein